MPASTTTLTVVGASAPAGAAFNEQQSDAAPGNKFLNGAGDVMLYARNTNVAARTLTFYADKYGAEREVLTATVPGSGTENGVAILGPFKPDDFNNHDDTEAASNGYVMFDHDGADGDLMLCPFKIPKRHA